MSVCVLKYFTGNLRKRKDAIAQNVPTERSFKFMIFYLRNVPMEQILNLMTSSVKG